jgi:hypothetical protein
LIKKIGQIDQARKYIANPPWLQTAQLAFRSDWATAANDKELA